MTNAKNATASINGDVFTTVSSLLRETSRVPFLFIGSGISRRYTHSESWEALLQWVCDSVGNPIKEWPYYPQQAESQSIDPSAPILPIAARLMESDFLEAVYGSKPEWKQWRQEHDSELSHSVSPLKIYISEHLRTFKICDNLRELSILERASNHVSGIITTNYDGFVNEIFPHYQQYIRQDDLLFQPITGVGEIYKIHGSIDDPNSLVLTDRDYNIFNEQQAYLVAKIMTIFGEYPVIFLGYSLNDPEILGILRAIADCAGAKRAAEFAKRFIFVSHQRDKSKQHIDFNHVILTNQNKPLHMTTIYTDDFSPLYRAIASAKQTYTPKLLNQLRRQVYSIAYSKQATETILTKDLDHLNEFPQDARIVVGISADSYGKQINGDDLYKDVLFHGEDPQLSIRLVVNDYLPKLVKGSHVLPIFAYLSKYDEILKPEVRKALDKQSDFETYPSKTEKEYRKKLRPKLGTHPDLTSLQRVFREDAYKHLTLLKQNEINSQELEDFLKPLTKDMLEKDGQLDSQIRKDIGILDFLKFGIPYLKKVRTPTVAHLGSSSQ
ncbi:SIR2 family protein [Bifidobacterium sp. ESL0745]|uniref:SIR2 family protein n=1 Tax=Bifidobacterium sp. ESL0745 TaxID=2983226 RepID=UPI0023F6EDE3|nr:SIR2 family protein [Bifidobacterium sp. ESL0745]MDF7665971.1 SIR2 family protein [Bifidobacterium sp. ESL0745]